jgi:hypothetical protein
LANFSDNVRGADLLSENNWWPTGNDEVFEDRPQVPFVFGTFSFACDTERLTRRRPCKALPVIWPSCKAQGSWPASDAAEEMLLHVVFDIVCCNFCNASLIYFSICPRIRIQNILLVFKDSTNPIPT